MRLWGHYHVPRCRSLTHHSLHVPWNELLIIARNSGHHVGTYTSLTGDRSRGTLQKKLVEVATKSRQYHCPLVADTRLASLSVRRPSEPVFFTVYGIDLGFTLTLFDISLFPLSYAVQSNPAWLFNRESWRTFFAKTSDRWIAHKQDSVVYLAKQFPFPLARVQLIFHSRGGCWWLQSEFNIHLPTISRACHFGAGPLFHALIHAAISSNWHTRSDLWQSWGTEWLPIKCTWACLSK